MNQHSTYFAFSKVTDSHLFVVFPLLIGCGTDVVVADWKTAARASTASSAAAALGCTGRATCGLVLALFVARI